ncbi:MAG: hypothetical protein QI223_06780, partial [Candidatus Korarchaeota archaeon]|nr:hypothetical protein [Candidatus Korarchaeota archaeon]
MTLPKHDPQRAFQECSKTLTTYSQRIRPTVLSEVLSCWSEGRVIDLPLSTLSDFFVRSERLQEILKGVLNFLREREWRGACVSVVGEYGSGKSQLSVALIRILRGRNVPAARVVLGPTSDVRKEILSRVEQVREEEPLVIVVDEVDQLIEDIWRYNDRRRLEELATLVRGLTEAGEDRPPRASFVLLLSKRAKAELEKDIALVNRLGRRLKEFRLTLPDDDRIRAARDATIRVMAALAAYNHKYKTTLNARFFEIYPVVAKKAMERALSREIGGVVKYLVDTLRYVLDHIDISKKAPSGTEFGRRAEEVWRTYMTKHLAAVRFTTVHEGLRRDYIATLETSRLRLRGRVSDAQYLVWPYDPERGEKGTSLVARISVEIKAGKSWVSPSSRDWDQLRDMLDEGPVLLFSIEEWDLSERESVEAQLSDGAPHSARIVEVDPDLMRL